MNRRCSPPSDKPLAAVVVAAIVVVELARARGHDAALAVASAITSCLLLRRSGEPNPGTVTTHSGPRASQRWHTLPIEPLRRADLFRRRLCARPERVSRWLRAHFVEPHRRRSQQLEYWWQLPDDPTRTRSPWLQLVVDLVAPATCSEWHERIAACRTEMYDGLRPSAIRTLALVVVVAALWAAGTPVSLWALVIPAGIQIPIETYMHGRQSDSAEERRLQIARWMRDCAPLNIVSVTGAVAGVLNIVAVAFAPSGGDRDWIKVAALAAGIFYLNSGLASALLDPPNYAENSVMPPVAQTIRPYVPLMSYLTVTGIVAAAVDLQRWETSMVPVAFLCAALTLLLGSTIRNHDRVIGAAAVVGRHAVEAGRKELGGVVHDDLGPAKAAAERISRQDGVAYRDVVDLQTLSAFLTHFSTRVGLFAAQRMHLGYLAKKIAAPYGISQRDVTCVIQWDEHALRKEDHRIALRMTTALVHNVGQALQKDHNRDVAKTIAVEGFTTGHGRNLRYHLAVRDNLPPIEDAHWCPEDGTLDALRQWLRDSFNGDLIQQQLGHGSKRIVASWGDRPPRQRTAFTSSVAACKHEMSRAFVLVNVGLARSIES